MFEGHGMTFDPHLQGVSNVDRICARLVGCLFVGIKQINKHLVGYQTTRLIAGWFLSCRLCIRVNYQIPTFKKHWLYYLDMVNTRLKGLLFLFFFFWVFNCKHV
jgi:hypothetical protein